MLLKSRNQSLTGAVSACYQFDRYCDNETSMYDVSDCSPMNGHPWTCEVWSAHVIPRKGNARSLARAIVLHDAVEFRIDVNLGDIPLTRP